MSDGLKIGDEVYVHGYVDEIRKDTVIIRNDGGFFGTDRKELAKKDEWIPIAEETPPDETDAIVTIQDVGNYYKPAHSWTGNGNFKNVIAWRPLPEEYKGSVGKEIKKC